MDQWYYLDGSETRGPVPSAQIAQLIRAGSLSAATQVAQVGWSNWSPASVALAHLLGMPQAAGEIQAYAIKVQCRSGPDEGKAYMIGASEVSIGRVAGIGYQDGSVADNHVVLSWQNGVLYFRTFPGSTLRVAGTDVTQGTLSNGQQFQLGSSLWQVGTAPVELTGLLGTLGERLNKLTSTDKLEGFSLGGMFSEVFRKREPGELEDYFVVGTEGTTPPLDQVQTGWPKPWFFMRVLIFLAACYFCFYKIFDIWQNPKVVPALIMMGSMAVPLATVFLFWELNTPRNISFPMVLMLVSLGGVVSLFVTDIGYNVANLHWLGAPSAGVIEETGKLLAVVLVVRNTKYKYILNGMVFGAAVGAGFASFETAGYAFRMGFFNGFLDYFFKNPQHEEFRVLLGHAQLYGYSNMLDQIHGRAIWAPFAHVPYSAIAAGALWRVKGSEKFRLSMLGEPLFLRMFLVPVVLHALWDLPADSYTLVRYIALSVAAWYFALLLVQQGLKQVRDAQLNQTKSEYRRTQEILTTTGRFGPQQVASL